MFVSHSGRHGRVNSLALYIGSEPRSEVCITGSQERMLNSPKLRRRGGSWPTRGFYWMKPWRQFRETSTATVTDKQFAESLKRLEEQRTKRGPTALPKSSKNTNPRPYPSPPGD